MLAVGVVQNVVGTRKEIVTRARVKWFDAACFYFVCELLHVPSAMFLHEKVNKYMHIIILYIYYISLFMHTCTV